MSYLVGYWQQVCSICGKTAKPFEEIREEEQPDGSIKVYGTLCVCACDPRYPGENLAHWRPSKEA